MELERDGAAPALREPCFLAPRRRHPPVAPDARLRVVVAQCSFRRWLMKRRWRLLRSLPKTLQLPLCAALVAVEAEAVEVEAVVLGTIKL